MNTPERNAFGMKYMSMKWGAISITRIIKPGVFVTRFKNRPRLLGRLMEANW